MINGLQVSMSVTMLSQRDILYGSNLCRRETAAASSCNKSLPDSSILRGQSPSSSHSCLVSVRSIAFPVDSLDEVMPQDASWVFQHSDKGGDFDLVILNRCPVLSVGSVWGIQLSQVDETSETPIALLSHESVMSVYSSAHIGAAIRSTRLTRRGLNGRVPRVGNGETKLSASMPSFRCLLWVGVVQVDRDHVIGLSAGVALREEQDSPVSVSRRRKVTLLGRIVCSPFMTTTAELGTDYTICLLRPVLDTPCLRLEILNLETQVGHRLGRVCLV